MAICVTFYQGERPIHLVVEDVTREEAMQVVSAAIKDRRTFEPAEHPGILINPAASMHIEIYRYILSDDPTITYEMDRASFIGA